MTEQREKAAAEPPLDRIVGHEQERMMKLPETPEEVRQFVMSDYCALKFGRDDFKPCEDDVYTMTAHDLLSAFYNWKLTQEPVPNA